MQSTEQASSNKLSANTPSTSPSFAFQKHQRLLTKRDYSHVFDDAPIRASNQHLLILSRINTGDKPCPRLGLVIAKKHVRHAHERNRIKRLTRESFRLQQHNLPPIDAIVLARKGVDSLSNQQLQQALHGLWKRIIKRARTVATT